MSTGSVESLRALFQDTLEMLALTWSSFRRHDPSRLEKAAALGRSIHKLEKELTARLLAAPADAEGLRFVPGHLERIGDAVEGLIRCLRTMAAEGTLFTDRAVREVNTLFEQAIELLECAATSRSPATACWRATSRPRAPASRTWPPSSRERTRSG